MSACLYRSWCNKKIQRKYCITLVCLSCLSISLKQTCQNLNTSQPSASKHHLFQFPLIKNKTNSKPRYLAFISKFDFKRLRNLPIDAKPQTLLEKKGRTNQQRITINLEHACKDRLQSAYPSVTDKTSCYCRKFYPCR